MIENKEKLKCNMCEAEMKYIDYNGTHIWSCKECPNIQIEFIEEKNIDDLQDYINDTTRTCDHCGKLMSEGYCIADGEEYYCSDECLHENYTQEQYESMHDDGDGDSYWTSWED